MGSLRGKCIKISANPVKDSHLIPERIRAQIDLARTIRQKWCCLALGLQQRAEFRELPASRLTIGHVSLPVELSA